MKINSNYIFLIIFSKKSLILKKNIMLGIKIFKRIFSQVKGFALRVVELLYKVNMLPLYTLVMFQHINSQQITSPAGYPFSAGEITKE